MRLLSRLRVFLPLAVAAACGPAITNVSAAADAGPVASPDATEQALVDPDPAAEALARARTAYAGRDLAAAAAAADETLAAAPAPEAADGARLLQARVALLERRWDDARRWLGEVRGADAKYVPGYRELAAVLAADAQRPLEQASEDERRATAERLAGLALVPGDDLVAAARLAVQLRLDLALGQRAALVQHAAAYLPLASSGDARRWTEEAEQVLTDPSALTENEVQELWTGVAGDSPLWPSLARRRIEVALAAGDLTTAGELLERAAGVRPGAPWLRELRERVASVADVDATRIGVLVPTTGPSAELGRRALAAMELALAPFGDRFVLEARDTGGDETRTREAVRALGTESKVVAILGPIEARVAVAAVEEAAAVGVPIVSLNVQRDVADAARCRFREFPTYAAEVEALIGYAWDHARGHRVAVLRATGRYGEIVAELVAEAVERRGGEVVAVEPYASDQTEFLSLATTLRRARPDVIVFADAASRVALVAPALAYEDLWPQPSPHDPASTAPGGPRREALYLLPSAAADPAALADARRYLDGAVAAVGFVAAARAEDRTPFETALAALGTNAPTQLEAFAYDAARIAATLLDGGAANRPALCRALAQAESAETAAPFAGFGADGEARRPVRLVHLHDGSFSALPTSP
ncbi:MAG: amino acid ABC transporter substrate-binding protein [Deltaproteobacteria bacterium]|nr:amino acid ABC transporter substrate-binding protein [Deltaproteobacteria bacterium]